MCPRIIFCSRIRLKTILLSVWKDVTARLSPGRQSLRTYIIISGSFRRATPPFYAPILILDDSVSAVDTKTEAVILENLRLARQGKTTLLIAHRVSTIERMDKILFLEDGALAAAGSHEELYASCPEYRKMVDLQKLEEGDETDE